LSLVLLLLLQYTTLYRATHQMKQLYYNNEPQPAVQD